MGSRKPGVLDLGEHDVGARDEHVERKDSCAALGLQLGGQLRGGAAVPFQGDAGVSSGEAVDHLAADDVAGRSVYDNGAFLASGREDAFPLRLGTRLSGGRGRAGGGGRRGGKPPRSFSHRARWAARRRRPTECPIRTPGC